MPYLRITYPEISADRRRSTALRLTEAINNLFYNRHSRLCLRNYSRYHRHTIEGINIRFHPYPPKDFAVGGRLLSDIVPRIGQLMKRLAGK